MRLALIGWGAIGQATARLLADTAIEIVAIAVRDAGGHRDGLPDGAALIGDPQELASFEPDLVAEAAGRDAVGPWGRAALALGVDIVVSSVSAFANPTLLVELRDHARENGAQIRIQPGALGGIDALAAARLMGIDTVEHRIVKPPAAWLGTPAEELCELGELTEAEAFFAANAAETADAFPKNANVAMTTALAGIGPEATHIELVADPAADTNRHEIQAAGAFGTLRVEIANQPLPDNPKSSAMAALNLVRSITNQVDPIAI